MSRSKKANKEFAPKTIKRARRAAKQAPASSLRVDSPREAETVQERTALQTGPGRAKKRNFQTNVLRAVSLLAVIGITMYIYSIRDRVAEFAVLGYPGVFLVALLANATILLPAPGLAIVYAMGGIFNPIGVGVAAGTGGAIGELSGYLAGFSGQAVIERTDIYDRIRPWVQKYGGWAIMVLSAIPNPFFDIVGIAAGIAKMPVKTFLFFAWVGQLIKMTTVALAGKYSIELLTNFIR